MCKNMKNIKNLKICNNIKNLKIHPNGTDF